MLHGITTYSFLKDGTYSPGHFMCVLFIFVNQVCLDYLKTLNFFISISPVLLRSTTE